MPNTKKTWRFALLLRKNPFPSHPAPPASLKNPANNLSDTGHQNPKNVHFSKFAHENPPPFPKTQDLKPKTYTQKIPLPLPLLQLATGHRPPATAPPHPPSSDKSPLTKTHNSRKNMPSPHPLARDADLIPEKYDA
jgi:hypothetical protein